MGPVDDADGRLRIELGEFSNRFMQLQPAVAAQIANAQPAFLVGAQLFRLPGQVLHLAQDRLAVGVEILSGGCQGKLPVGAVDQFYPQLFLQRSDLLGDGRLGDIAPLRGLCKAVAVHHSGKVFHLSEQQSLPPPGKAADVCTCQSIRCAGKSKRGFVEICALTIC